MPEINLFSPKAEATETADASASDFEYTVNENSEVIITQYIGQGGTEIKIPSTIEGNIVTTIGERAFESVSSILGALYLPDSIKTIEQYTFLFFSNPSVKLW